MTSKPTTALDLTPLFEIEELDLKLRSIEARLKEIPGRREGLSAELARVERSAREKEQASASKEKGLATLELDLKTNQSQEAEKKVKLNNVKTQKEYDALKEEIQNAAADRGKLEEKILMLMDEITELKDLVKRSKQTIDAEKKKISEELAGLATAESGLQTELKTLKEESAAKVQSMPEDLRREYTRLRATLPEGQILAKLTFEDNIYACSACNSPVPHQFVIDIKRDRALQRCHICHRLLHP